MNERMTSTTSRRDFVTSVVGFGAACAFTDWNALQAALTHAAHAAAQQPTPPLIVFTAEEAAVINAAADRIIPKDDAPGASDAGVIYFFDRAFSTFMKDQLTSARKDLRDLNARARRRNKAAQTFADLTPSEQDAVLKEIEDTPLFGGLRYLTIVGMFANSSWGGNRDNAGWKMIGFAPLPVHQPPFGYYDAQEAKGGR